MNEIWYLFAFMVFVAGLYTIVKEVVYPIADLILFVIGYFIFEIWQLNLKKVAQHPLKVPRLISLLIINGVDIWASPGHVTEVNAGNKHWKPYFHYWREQR